MGIKLPIVLDGATGSRLMEKGCPIGTCIELWCLEHPEIIKEIQASYVEAGSQLIYAPTVGANRISLGRFGIAERLEEINVRLLELSREAAGGRALVAGNLAPVGSFAPRSREELFDVYREQAEVLDKAGADAFVIETMLAISDTEAALKAVKSVCDKPVLVSFTIGKDGKTHKGEDLRSALCIMQEQGADIFGVNCSLGPRQVADALISIADSAKIPLMSKPSAGLPRRIAGKIFYEASPEDFAACVPELAKVGVRAFGACCGSNELSIAAIAEALRKLPVPPPVGFTP
ncbi:MAG TPA: homocysteine S-methyltransferase family protein [Bacillota bacterium]|nr:homocysteine S-methyltransferase family protein [Bacillota bacterium]